MIIRLGEDSSEEEEEEVHAPPPSGVQRLLGGLDMFLKEARRSSEVGLFQISYLNNKIVLILFIFTCILHQSTSINFS